MTALERYPILISSNLMKKGKVPDYHLRWVDSETATLTRKGYSCALLKITYTDGLMEMRLARTADKDEKYKYYKPIEKVKIDLEWKA